MSDQLLFTEAEWDVARRKVAADMTSFLKAYRAPVFEDFGDHGDGWGSGAYIDLGNRHFLLTNEHVAVAREQGRTLIHQFLGQDDLRPIVGNHVAFPHPFDLALLPVDDKAWADLTNQSRAIALEQIALAHDPAPTELLTFTGFAGAKVGFHFDTLTSTATCSTAREVSLPQDDPRFSSRFHFGLDYKPDLATDVIAKEGLPLPPGLSGSVVWDTGFVRAKMIGQSWTPDIAKVTGVVWGWPSEAGCLVATRAEYLRSFLLGTAPTLGLSFDVP